MWRRRCTSSATAQNLRHAGRHSCCCCLLPAVWQTGRKWRRRQNAETNIVERADSLCRHSTTAHQFRMHTAIATRTRQTGSLFLSDSASNRRPSRHPAIQTMSTLVSHHHASRITDDTCGEPSVSLGHCTVTHCQAPEPAAPNAPPI